jgi:hypothetical protein
MRPLSNEPASTRGRFNCLKTNNCSLQNGLQMWRALPVRRPNEVGYLPTVPFVPKRYGNELWWGLGIKRSPTRPEKRRRPKKERENNINPAGGSKKRKIRQENNGMTVQLDPIFWPSRAYYFFGKLVKIEIERKQERHPFKIVKRKKLVKIERNSDLK